MGAAFRLEERLFKQKNPNGLMRILAIGDLHGTFPSKLRKAVKREKIDVILSVGDYPNTDVLRDLEFKHWSEKKRLEEIVGKTKYRKILKDTIDSANIPMRGMVNLNKRVITIYGNSDILNKEAKKYGFHGFEYQCKKFGIKLLKTDTLNLGSFVLAGFSGYRGAMSKKLTKADSKKKNKIKRYNSKWRKRLDKIFSKTKGERVIFLAHDVPRGYFDKVNYKKSPMHSKHVGDEYFTEYIRKYQPELFLCGHMHEYQGLKKLGGTSIINVGDGAEGKAAVIEIDEGKVKSVKFIR